MIYFILAIIIFTIIMSYYIDDIRNIFLINGIITTIAGYITIIFNYILSRVITRKVSFINISKITDIVFMRAVNKGLLLILFGGVEFMVYIIIFIYKKRRIINK